MHTIDVFILIVTILSFASGVARLNVWWHGLTVIVALACLAWLVRYQSIMAGDVAQAEDYYNDLTFGFAALEIALAIIWLCVFYAIGLSGRYLANLWPRKGNG
jgi:hypothetical protein